jgi:hypothetical protein
MRRFAQPDTIVPEPGNPQSLNRYSYSLVGADETVWHGQDIQQIEHQRGLADLAGAIEHQDFARCQGVLELRKE